jgi:hypothetical protein
LTPKQKPIVRTLNRRGTPPRRSLREILQQKVGSSGVPLWGSVATSESAVEISAKGSDESVVRNLPEVKREITLLGVSSTDIPLQEASTSSTHTAGEGLAHPVSGVRGLRLAKKALSGCARRKLKKARSGASKAVTGGSQQPGNTDSSKQGKTPTDTFKKPRSEGSTPTEKVRAPKWPRDLQGG